MINRVTLCENGPELSALVYGTWRLLDDPTSPSPADLAALLESTGFEVVECRLLGETTRAVFAVARKGGNS